MCVKVGAGWVGSGNTIDRRGGVSTEGGAINEKGVFYLEGGIYLLGKQT